MNTTIIHGGLPLVAGVLGAYLYWTNADKSTPYKGWKTAGIGLVCMTGGSITAGLVQPAGLNDHKKLLQP